MHLHFERNANAKCDCPILSLTWMGKVPDELPEDEGWKLNRTNYYQEGWLATGNVRGIVGVTFTTSHCKKTVDFPLRTNYNLRGHRSEVILVKWNEPYQKLASCDSSGIIFVWIKYEGRWSIELINDRNTPVTHFAWSHDGRMALICYNDGFVLVGSVAGQRYWSSMLNLDSTITCGIWTPDDLHVYFGTSQGGLVVMDVHGAMVAQVALAQAPVTGMAWSCEKFKMEEGEDTDGAENSALVLAVSVSTGHIYLMKSYDDVSPTQIYTGLGGPLCMEWSNSRQLLAVAGVANHSADNTDYVNMLKCYSDTGVLMYTTVIPFTQSPVTALTWGHNDKRLFIATGGMVHIAWVSRRVATLQLLCRLQVASSLPLGESSVRRLPLPPRLKHLISNLFAQTIRCCVPGVRGIREFVSRAPLNGTRLHCTMIRHDDENMSSGACYTLYLEYLGGLVPLLKGKRTSKIRPEFVIFDPQVEGSSTEIPLKLVGHSSDTSDTEREDGCSGSPRMQRRRKRRNKSPADFCDDLTYVDTLPESARLVEVTSNIWGTKFKIHGLADCVPTNLGQVTYKTSLLHLQPRQMSLVMTELRDLAMTDFLAPDPTFNPNVFSEDEEEEKNFTAGAEALSHPTGAIPIAPMTPKNLRQTRGNRFMTQADPGSPRFIRARAPTPRTPLAEDEPSTSRMASQRPTHVHDWLRRDQALRPIRTTMPHLHVGQQYSGPCVIQFEPGEPLRFPDRQVPYLARNRKPRLDQSFQPPEIPSYETLHGSASSRTRCEDPSQVGLHGSTPSRSEEPSHTNIHESVFSRSRCEDPSKEGLLGPVPSRREEPSHASFHGSSRSRCEDPKQGVLHGSVACRSRSEDRCGERSRLLRNQSFLAAQSVGSQIPSEWGPSASATEPSQATYQAEIERIVKKLDEMTEMKSPSGRPNSIEDESSYTDCNLNDVISFCESYKLDEGGCGRPRRYRRKPDKNETCFLNHPQPSSSSAAAPNSQTADSIRHQRRISRSCSVGFLDDVDTGLIPCQLSLILLKRDAPKRLFLVRKKPVRKPKASQSLDSCEFSALRKSDEETPKVPEPEVDEPKTNNSRKEDHIPSPTPRKPFSPLALDEIEEVSSDWVHRSIFDIPRTPNPPRRVETVSQPEVRSQPASPAMAKKKRNQSSSPIRKHILNSPLLRRRRKSKTESSDDEVGMSGDEGFTNKGHYKDLETFQKAQLRQKLKRGKVGDGHTPRVRELVMHNKAPMWNENSQVYQLDFGGRVTQESAKNFQIEFKGKQVMQFGRIDGNAYTLDFQYPFSVLQAFAVALANVTQRLK